MNVNEKLNQLLENGETIQWSGVPQPYSIFDPSRKASTITTLCVALLWTIISVGGYYASGTEIKTGIVIFFLAISAIIVWMPISDKGRIKKLLYGITDRRVIVTAQENSDPITMPIADIDDIRIDEGDNGNCHVRVGSRVFKASAKKLPGLAYRGEYDDQDGKKKYKGLVLFNVTAKDGKTIESLLKK